MDTIIADAVSSDELVSLPVRLHEADECGKTTISEPRMGHIIMDDITEKPTEEDREKAIKFIELFEKFISLPIEIWKDIEGFDGLYQVSNLGRIKSLLRNVVKSNGNNYTIRERVLKQCISKKGYYFVNLHKDGKQYMKKIHRLKAIHFIPNPNNLPCLNHKNGNKLDNTTKNLEWCTHGHNNQHAYDTGLKIGAMTGKFGADNHSSKAVQQLDKNTDIVLNTFGSAHEAKRETGISYQHICEICRGSKRRKTAGGFKWRFANE
jgi:hypothetical protein